MYFFVINSLSFYFPIFNILLKKNDTALKIIIKLLKSTKKKNFDDNLILVNASSLDAFNNTRTIPSCIHMKNTFTICTYCDIFATHAFKCILVNNIIYSLNKGKHS